MQSWHGTAVCTAFLILASAVTARADGGEGFTFRVVKPPAGGGQRITVQITEPLPTPKRKVKDLQDALPGEAVEGGFWAAISPARDAEGRGGARLEAAMDALAVVADAPREPTDALLQGIVRRHGADIRQSAARGRISPALALAVIAVESSGRADAVSKVGATGLMQLMPATAERFGVTDAAHPGQNVAGGIAYLDWLLARFGGDPILALAAYNAGEGAVDAHFGVPPYAETRGYVPKVVAAWKVARTLCAVPPDGPRSPCEFVETS